MKRKNAAALLAVLAMPLSIGAAQAAKPVDPSKLPKVECSEVKFGEAFLSKYPHAPAACLEGREYNGKRYAKFDAKVYITGPEITTVTLVNAEGESLDTFSLKPGPDQKIKVNGKDTKFSDLRKGEKITFWVPEDRMEASELPGSTETSWAVLPPLPKP